MKPIAIHMTNIHGRGAIVLMSSLVPAMLDEAEAGIARIYLLGGGHFQRLLSGYGVDLQTRRRYLPKALSRAFEVLVFSRRFGGDGGLLVLGDLPLRGVQNQTVLVHTPFLFGGFEKQPFAERIKNRLMRAVFRMNAGWARAFIVQTEHIALALQSVYGIPQEKIVIIPHPPPTWALDESRGNNRPSNISARGLRLFYPAKSYSHKNHALLGGLSQEMLPSGLLEGLTLTIDEQDNPNARLSAIQCLGEISLDELIKVYHQSDGLLFLSHAESYGLPLVEAMYLGKPIICPDLPYARELCQDTAIYFTVDKPESLIAALVELKARLDKGWAPDWTDCLSRFPRDWPEAARRFLAVASEGPGC